jgi:AraC-like DNA-binding protein
MMRDDELFRRLCRSRDFIESEADQRVRLADAAEQAFLSPFHYHRLFTHTFGETPHEFLTRLRIDRARQYLAQGMPVTEVCFAVGYESVGSFSARFRSIVGKSPSQFQQGLRRIFPVPHPPIHRFIPNCFLIRHGVRPF